jgi:hypothetical protein
MDGTRIKRNLNYGTERKRHRNRIGTLEWLRT